MNPFLITIHVFFLPKSYRSMLPWMTVGWTLLVAVADPDVIAAVVAVGCCSAVCCIFFTFLALNGL